MNSTLSAISELDYLQGCSRFEALNDGMLIDLSGIAIEAGIRYPLAITPSVYLACIATQHDYELGCESDRAHDLAFQIATLARGSFGQPESFFDFVVERDELDIVPLKVVASFGDFGEPVLTVLLEHE
jgi:hypothetical protein